MMRRLTAARQKNSIGCVTLFVVMLFTSSVGAQTDLSIMYAPMVLELVGERGTSVPFEITILNDSQFATAHFQADVFGLSESRSGVYNLRKVDDWEYGASSWVELSETEFTVQPGEYYVLRGLVRIPRQAPPSGYATVVAVLVPEEAPEDVAASTSYFQQFPVALEITIGQNHRRSAFISEFRVIPTGSSPELSVAYGRDALLFLASLENDGDVHVRGKGQLIIRDMQGRRIRTVPLGTGRGVIIPQATLDFGSVVRGLAPGEYEIEARIDYGGHRPAVARTTLEIDADESKMLEIVGGRALRVDVAPARIELALQRQGYRAATVTLTNHDTVDVRFKVYAEELLHDFDGSPVTVEPGVVLPYSAAAWVQVRPDEFVLRPGQRRNIVIGFQVPEFEDGGRYTRIRIQAEPAEPEEDADASVVITDLDVSAFLSLGTQLVRSIAVDELYWEQIPNTPFVRVGMLVQNTGNIHFPVEGRVTLLRHIPAFEEIFDDLIVQHDERWDVVEQKAADVSSEPALPGESRFVQVALDTPFEPLTQYEVYIEVVIPESRPQAYRVNLWMDADGVIHLGNMPEEDNI